jgi:hypothetical protein
MKVVCINIGSIKSKRCEFKATCLNIGEIYTSLAKFVDEHGDNVYFIKELNRPYLCERFRPIDDSWIDEALIKAIKEVESEPVKINSK